MFLLLSFLDTWGQARKGSSPGLRTEAGKPTPGWLATWSLKDKEEQNWFKLPVVQGLVVRVTGCGKTGKAGCTDRTGIAF